MKDYFVEDGYMGYVDGSYLLFADQRKCHCGWNAKLSISGNIIQQAYNRITESRIMEGKQGIEQELSRVAGIPEVQ